MENTKVQFTVDNLTNEEPPLLYQNNVLNSNTDVSTYDLVGTYYRVSLSTSSKQDRRPHEGRAVQAARPFFSLATRARDRRGGTPGRIFPFDRTIRN